MKFTPPTPITPHPIYAAHLALRIAHELDGEKTGDAFLALLLNVEFVLEDLLNRNFPEELAEQLRKLHDLVITASRTGLQALSEDPQ